MPENKEILKKKKKKRYGHIKRLQEPVKEAPTDQMWENLSINMNYNIYVHTHTSTHTYIHTYVYTYIVYI